jgi:hypothetical protein
MPDDIDLSDFDALGRILARLGDLAFDAAETAMDKTVLYLLSQIPEYPPVVAAGGDWLKKSTPKARSWFFWAVKKGKVPGWKWVEDEAGGHAEGQYPRSGQLGRSFTTQVTREQDSIIGQIGTNQVYAPWVVGPDHPGRQFTYGGHTQTMYQASIHKGRWWQFERVIEQALPAAQEEFETVFYEELARLAEQSHRR